MIGSREPYPHWLKKQIAEKNIRMIEGLCGITDAAIIQWGNRKKYYYDMDFIVKLPEGPVIGVEREKFFELYQPQDARTLQEKNEILELFGAKKYVRTINRETFNSSNLR